MKMDNNLKKQRSTALKYIFESRDENEFKINNVCLEEIYDLFVKVSSGEDINVSSKLDIILKRHYEN